MTLLLLISGNPEILQQHSTDAQVVVVKIDDKIISQPKRIKQLIAEHNATAVVVGTKELKFQRFQIIWKMLFFVLGLKDAAIIDEAGSKNSFSVARLFVVELPFLVAECIASVAMIAWAYVMFPILRKGKRA
ncbi:MAG: hypothetical protein JNJ85_15870 [Candidatus Kapabacteria bacterium]|nr:hypothetical protein [Candidatus Kapabacteria bacterium]